MIRGALFTIAVVLGSAAPMNTDTQRETIVIEGTARIAVPPLLQRGFEGRVASITVEPIPDRKNEWRLTYQRYEHHCSLVARGPRENLTILPEQTCTVRIDEAELRGTCRAFVDSGTLIENEDGRSTLELRARVDARVQRFVNVTLLGRSFQRWVPVPTPPGQAHFVGRTASR